MMTWDMKDYYTKVVMDVIQRVYSDNSQSTLDRRAASEILRELEKSGWMDPATIRMIVGSAPDGKLVIDDYMMMRPPEELQTWRQFDPPATVLKAVRH